ncbi:MAG: hypothetical protein JW893_03675 [Candidatus Omnitrophica bacterium]|nr:hypothetical protein [Candidatus Omnitrophota bacterium]
MKIILFSLTGFGNTVLPALLNIPDVWVTAVFTTIYKNKFPYYEEEALVDLCKRMKITCSGEKILNSVDLIKTLEPDLIIVATFAQIVPRQIINIPKFGIVNIHPSLLPKYRGPCPFYAVVKNKEKETGVSIHYLTEELDAGDILLQRSLPLSESDTENRVIQKTAVLAASMIPDLIDLFRGGKIPQGWPQDPRLVTYAPKVIRGDSVLRAYEENKGTV